MSRIFDTYDIVCYKKTWSSTTDIKDVNIFSGVNPLTVEAIDMKDYMMDMSDLSYDFDEAEKENGENQLFYVSSDITFKLSGIENSDYLKTFFGLYTNTDYIKWHVKLSVAGVTIWEGLINHESIELKQSPDDDSDIISVTVLSFEKEFKQYYQNVRLPYFAGGKRIIGLMNAGYGGIRHGQAIAPLIEYLFPRTNWGFETGLDEWHIIDNPVLCLKNGNYGSGKNFVFAKSSSERIRTNGENCYDFLRRICNSMGWVFYYYQGNFVIKNRATDIPTLTTLDCEEILDRTVTKYKETTTFDHILLLDGEMSGGDGTGGNESNYEGFDMQPYQMRGARFRLFSDYANPDSITNGNWWLSINERGADLQQYVGTRFIRYFNEDNETFRTAVHTKDDSSNWSPNGVRVIHGHWSIDVTGMTQADMLRIDCGDTGNAGWLYQHVADNGYYGGWNAAYDYAGTEGNVNPDNSWFGSYQYNRVRFKGNYGSSLVKLTATTGGYVINTDYEDYKETNLFSDNFQKFFNSRTTRKISIKYNDVITNPIQVFQFTNDTEGNYEGTWIINNMKINVLEETTTFELQKKLEESDRI